MISVVLSGPLGMVFGLVTWAAMRGRGGLMGLVSFTFFGAVGAAAGAVAAQTFGGASDDLLTLGAIAGAALASLTEVVAFGRAPRIADALPLR
jgi:hypothetical protein